MYCSRCGNKEPKHFAYKNNRAYCRLCLEFSKPIATISKSITPKKPTITMPYRLTKEQRKIAYALLKQEGPIYLRAVCGAGKTEITFPSIYRALQQGKRVGIAIPRKEVVKELSQRLSKVFNNITITSVFGGNDQQLDGDIIILTTHQTYRYPQKFGLLIIDEYDAFPFANNPTLQHFTKQSCYGKSIYLSATFQDNDVQNKTYYELNQRPHKQPLPLPRFLRCGGLLSRYRLYHYLKKHFCKRRIFIYVPTIHYGKQLSSMLRFLGFHHVFFSSKSESRQFQDIQEGKYWLVLTTTILERGITMANLHVLVTWADHPIFDYKTLIQIAGRVGRKTEFPTGDVLFFGKRKTRAIQQVLQDITKTNEKMSVL